MGNWNKPFAPAVVHIADGSVARHQYLNFVNICNFYIMLFNGKPPALIFNIEISIPLGFLSYYVEIKTIQMSNEHIPSINLWMVR